jgi:hypothetical protein
MTKRGRIRFFLPWLLALGCSSPQFEGRVYRAEDVAFRVGSVPRTWHRIELDGPAFAFRDDAARTTVAVNARCHLDGDDVPLKALTEHLFLHFSDREVKSQRFMKLDGREALRTEIVARLDGVPMHYAVYVLKKNWCVYDFVHIAEPSSPAASREAFDRFVRGFGTLG